MNLAQCVATWTQAYEIHNPSFPDINLEDQISYGINDWEAEDHNDQKFVGETKAKAEANRAAYYGA